MTIITICGADNKVGSTMIAQCLAETAAKKHEGKRFLTISADIAGCEFYAAESGKSLSGLMASVISGTLKGSEIKDNCVRRRDLENLFMLRGTDSYTTRGTFYPGHANMFLNAASDEFDCTVVDIGTNIQTGFAIGFLKHSNFNILVTTQQAHSLSRYNLRKQDIIRTLGVRFGLLALNKYTGLRNLDGISLLEEKYGAEESAAIPYSEFCWQAEKESASLLSFNDKGFAKGMAALEKSVMLPAGFGATPADSPKTPANAALRLLRRG
jgi:MinD-like ATPase involved in chromosome partitioning or flagellar assembly